MFTLIWVTLLFADKGSGTRVSGCAMNKHNITLNERNLTAEARLCVVLQCSFTAEVGFDAKQTLYKKDNKNTDSQIKGLVSLLDSYLKKKNCSIIFSDLTKSDSGSCQLKAVNKMENGCTLISNFRVTVTDLKELDISGSTAVRKGDTLNLTFSADSFTASSVNQDKSASNKSLNSESASLLIPNMTAELSGQYICTATYLNETITKTINVTLFAVDPRILNSSGCELQSEVLTCVCISEGFPLPTIKWPHLESHTEYSITTSVSNTTVTSTITASLKHHHSTTIECVSNNHKGEAKENIAIKENHDLFKQLLKIVAEPKVIIAALTGFVIGIILSAIIACLVTKSCRKKQRRSENVSENLEMVTTEAVPMVDADQAAVYDGIHEPEEAESVGQSAPDGDVGPTEVEYSSIDFSAIKTKNPEAEKRQDTTDTEYAEIKTEERRQENGQEDSERSEGNEEKEVMIGEDNDAKQAEEEGGENVALYSSVDELMD